MLGRFFMFPPLYFLTHTATVILPLRDFLASHLDAFARAHELNDAHEHGIDDTHAPVGRRRGVNAITAGGNANLAGRIFFVTGSSRAVAFKSFELL